MATTAWTGVAYVAMAGVSKAATAIKVVTSACQGCRQRTTRVIFIIHFYRV